MLSAKDKGFRICCLPKMNLCTKAEVKNSSHLSAIDKCLKGEVKNCKLKINKG